MGEFVTYCVQDRLGIIRRMEFHERVAPWLAALRGQRLVGDDLDGLHRRVLLENLPEILLGGLCGEGKTEGKDVKSSPGKIMRSWGGKKAFHVRITFSARPPTKTFSGRWSPCKVARLGPDARWPSMRGIAVGIGQKAGV